ncbi:membrane protein [gut metagenome]|uniref:Membrane protein n=1 Tax=gut metagenome TaxID=749906 RepID=J9CH22_9ZZZZ
MRMTAQNCIVQLTQEFNCLQIFLATMLVLLPLTITAVVIQIKHAGHCIHTQPVHMILLNPEQGTGYQERLHFRHSVIEHHGTPFFVLTSSGIGVFIAGSTIIHIQTKGILWKMRRNPVHNNADATLMALIHKIHKVFGSAIAAGRREVAGDLIAPTSIERMFGNGQKLHMRVAHFLQVRHQQISQLGIIIWVSVFLHAPTSHMHLIDAHGRIDRILFVAHDSKRCRSIHIRPDYRPYCHC